MINEQKVKRLYRVALYEQEEENQHRQISRYYRNDYIAKEMLKSIFTGTMAYLFMSALWVAGDWMHILEQMSQNEFDQLWIPAALIYVVYTAVYLAVTYMVYRAKYEESSRRTKSYELELMHLSQMYEQEE